VVTWVHVHRHRLWTVDLLRVRVLAAEPFGREHADLAPTLARRDSRLARRALLPHRARLARDLIPAAIRRGAALVRRTGLLFGQGDASPAARAAHPPALLPRGTARATAPPRRPGRAALPLGRAAHAPLTRPSRPARPRAPARTQIHAEARGAGQPLVAGPVRVARALLLALASTPLAARAATAGRDARARGPGRGPAAPGRVATRARSGAAEQVGFIRAA